MSSHGQASYWRRYEATEEGAGYLLFKPRHVVNTDTDTEAQSGMTPAETKKRQVEHRIGDPVFDLGRECECFRQKAMVLRCFAAVPAQQPAASLLV